MRQNGVLRRDKCIPALLDVLCRRIKRDRCICFWRVLAFISFMVSLWVISRTERERERERAKYKKDIERE